MLPRLIPRMGRGRRSYQRGRSLKARIPKRSFVGSGLPQVALARRRLFHLGSHGTEIVRRRDDREENDEQASQGQQALQRTEFARANSAAPQPEGWKRQQQPRQIQKQFHEPHGRVAMSGSATVSFSEIENRSQCALVTNAK
jgi:hypothetical protein